MHIGYFTSTEKVFSDYLQNIMATEKKSKTQKCSYLNDCKIIQKKLSILIKILVLNDLKRKEPNYHNELQCFFDDINTVYNRSIIYKAHLKIDLKSITLNDIGNKIAVDGTAWRKLNKIHFDKIQSIPSKFNLLHNGIYSFNKEFYQSILKQKWPKKPHERSLSNDKVCSNHHIMSQLTMYYHIILKY